MAANAPEFSQRPGQPERCLGLPPLQGPRQRRPQVVVLGLQPLQPRQLLWSVEPGLGRFGQGQEVRGVGVARGRRLAACRQRSSANSRIVSSIV